MARSRKTVCVGCKWHEKDGVSIIVKAKEAKSLAKTKVTSSRTSPLPIHFFNQNENLNLFTNLKPIV